MTENSTKDPAQFTLESDPIEEGFWFGLIVLLGLGLRLIVPFSVSFPLNDGGLFYSMALDVEANHFALPATTSYNLSGIPFAYPPLGIYAAALIHRLSGWELLDIVRLLPPLIACLSLLPAWKIIGLLVANPLGRLLAFLAYALNYSAYEWAIMGGGVTRSPGMFFALMAIWAFLALGRSGSIRDLVLSGLFIALTVLSHPQCIYFLAVSLAVLWMFRESRVSFRHLLGISLIAAILLSPWVIALVKNGNGLAFLHAIQTSSTRGNSALRPFYLLFESSVTPTLLAAGIIIGALTSLLRKQFCFAVWFLLLFFVPRLASFYTALPAALLFGSGLSQVAFDAIRARNIGIFELRGALGRGLLVFALAAFVGSSWSRTAFLEQTVFTNEEVESLQTLANSTPPDATLIVLGMPNKPDHFITEWMPALTKRRGLLTPEGKEWLNAKEFTSIVLSWAPIHDFMRDPMRNRTDETMKLISPADYILIRTEAYRPALLPGWMEHSRFGSLMLLHKMPAGDAQQQ